MTYKQQPTFGQHLHYKLQSAFRQAWEGFPDLHHHKIIVKHRDLKKVSMRAQPIVDQNIFKKGHRSYQIEVNQKLIFQDDRKLYQLPHAVLVGWFAHELGHLKDYQSRSGFGLLRLGIAYSLLPAYKIGVERKADLLALQNGFGPYLERTKRFLLREGGINPAYLARLKKYYMSIEEINRLMEERERSLRLPHTVH